MIRENLDLRGKSYEIPQAQADILSAGLRANPVFYADAQLVPYGRYTRDKPGRPDPVRRERLLPARHLPEAAGPDPLRHPGQAGDRGPVPGRRPQLDRPALRRLRQRPGGPADGPLLEGERRGARRSSTTSRSSSTAATRTPGPTSPACRPSSRRRRSACSTPRKGSGRRSATSGRLLAIPPDQAESLEVRGLDPGPRPEAAAGRRAGPDGPGAPARRRLVPARDQERRGERPAPARQPVHRRLRPLPALHVPGQHARSASRARSPGRSA